MNELLRCDEVAKRLGIHISTIRAWVREGRIPAYRLGGRFTRVAWEEVLGALAENAAGRSVTRESDSCARRGQEGNRG